MKFTRWGNAIAVTSALVWRAAAQSTGPEGDDIIITSRDSMSEVEFDPAGMATARNGVIVKWKGSVVLAQKIQIDRGTSQADAEGDVEIEYQDKQGHHQLWRGNKIHYNFDTKLLDALDFRVGRAPLYVGGAGLSGSGLPGGTQVATNAVITTEDLAQPGYKIKARRIVIDANKRVKADDAVMYIGRLPVMYFPHYSRSFDGDPNFWTVTPGYRSVWGAFLLTAYHWNVRTNLEFVFDLDYRQRRGPGIGPEARYDLGDLGKGAGRFYYLNDDSPNLGGFKQPIDRNRYRYDFKHSATNEDGFHFLGVVHGESDLAVWHDYDERAFRADPQPKSFVEADQQWSNWILDGLVQPRVNDFYNTVERLPDVKLTGLRQQIGETPIFYESESSIAYLRFQPSLLGGTNFSAMRGDSFQQLLLPQTYFGWLNVTPRAGGRLTHYGEVDNVPGITTDRDRWVFQTGVDLSFKASRVWSDEKSEWLQMDGLRHVVEPTVSYVYTPRPDKTPVDLPRFDTEVPSSRLLPLIFPNYNQIDSIDSENTLRLGLRNSLQTKREGKVENLLYWSAYTDWRLSPNPGQTTFPDFFSDVEFIPQSWITLSSQLRYDINGRHWRESNSRATIAPTDEWSWTIGHRYLRDDPLTYGDGNNAFYNSLYFRINEDWGLRTMHQFEGRTGVLQEQQYVVYRDLRSWTAAFVFRLRENAAVGASNGNTDWTIALMLSLKAFPRYRLGADRDQPNALFGY